MILAGFIALLKATPAVNNATSARVYAQQLPRDYRFPALVVHKYGGLQEYEYAGPQNTREDQIQIDVYAGDADTCESLAETVRALLLDFKTSLSDGTAVSACYLERDMDIPFSDNANQKGQANRRSLGFRVVSLNV